MNRTNDSNHLEFDVETSDLFQASPTRGCLPCGVRPLSNIEMQRRGGEESEGAPEEPFSWLPAGAIIDFVEFMVTEDASIWDLQTMTQSVLDAMAYEFYMGDPDDALDPAYEAEFEDYFFNGYEDDMEQ